VYTSCLVIKSLLQWLPVRLQMGLICCLVANMTGQCMPTQSSMYRNTTPHRTDGTLHVRHYCDDALHKLTYSVMASVRYEQCGGRGSGGVRICLLGQIGSGPRLVCWIGQEYGLVSFSIFVVRILLSNACWRCLAWPPPCILLSAVQCLPTLSARLSSHRHGDGQANSWLTGINCLNHLSHHPVAF